MGRTRGKRMAADVVARWLAHWFDPSTDFTVEDGRHVDRGSWDVPWGDERATKQGDPRPGEALGDHDGRSADFDGSDDFISFGDPARFDFADGVSFSFGGLFTKASGGDAYLISKRDVAGGSDTGWSIRLNDDNSTIRGSVDDGSTRVNPAFTASPGDGNTHTVNFIHDGPGTAVRGHYDGVEQVTESGDVTGLQNGADLLLARRNDGLRQLAGLIGLIWVVVDRLTEPMAAFFDAVLRDRSVDVPSLPIYGHPETGLKRRLPSYIRDHSVDHWWTHRRHRRGLDGEGIAQLTDHAGSQYGVQRTDSSQPIARGSTTRDGSALDHAEFTAADQIGHPDAVDDPSALSGVFRLSQASSQTGTLAVYSHYDGGTAEITLEYDADNTRYQLQIVDSAGTTVTLTDTTSGIDPTSGYHTVGIKVDESGDHALRVDGTEVATDTTDLSADNFSASTRQTGARNGSGGAAFDLRDELYVDDTAWTDATFSEIESGVAT